MSLAVPTKATTGRGAPSPRPAGTRHHPVHTLSRLALLAPAVVLLLAFIAGPIIYSFYGSLTNRALTGPKAAKYGFVGLTNYVHLFSSSDFLNGLLLTVVFVLFSAVVGQNIIGLLVAMLMRSSTRPVRAFVGATVVIAWIIPEIVAAMTCYAFFSTDGTLNSILGAVGLGDTPWLYEFPMLSVILANVWRGTAFSMMMYSAALAEVPPEIVEAAEVDGASAAQRFFHVTVPVIRRSISTNLMLITLQTLGVFTLIFVMTGGGPGFESSTLPVLAYQEAFKFSQIGYGTAIAVVTLVVGAIFSIVYIKLLKPEVD